MRPFKLRPTCDMALALVAFVLLVGLLDAARFRRQSAAASASFSSASSYVSSASLSHLRSRRSAPDRRSSQSEAIVGVGARRQTRSQSSSSSSSSNGRGAAITGGGQGQPYRVTVHEGVEEGAVVLSVFAIPGARIQSVDAFQLSADEGLFRLDKSTGNVLATRHIDRETLCGHQCDCTRRIRLSNGNERFTIIVSIMDKDDNPPVFPQKRDAQGGPLVLSVSENRDTRIQLQTPQDHDCPDSHKALFYIFADSPDATELFSINHSRYIEVLRARPTFELRFGQQHPASGSGNTLDYEKRATYSIKLYACSNKTFSRTACGSLDVELRVQNENEFDPVFLAPPNMNSTLPPGFVHKLTVPETDTVIPLMPVRAIDSDRGDNESINYRIERSTCVTPPPVPPMACQQRTDQLAPQRLSGPPGYQAPRDSALTNAGQFEIASLSPHESNSWSLTATQLDFEQCRLYSIDMIAADRSTYAPDEASARTAKLTLQLSLSDVNDNPPCIQVTGSEQKGRRPRVPENRPISHTNPDENLVQGVLIEVADPDLEVFKQVHLLRCKAIARPSSGSSPTATTSYSPTFFRVVPRSATDGGDAEEDRVYRLEAMRPFDRETTPAFEVTVQCTDRPESEVPDASLLAPPHLNSPASAFPYISYASFEVDIADQNDNGPIFEHSSYTFELSETDTRDTSFTVRATDSDESGNNSALDYRLEGTANFSVDANGRIRALQQFDREQLAVDTFDFVVVATDRGVPQRSSSASVHIKILDVNEYPPSIEDQIVFFPVLENTPGVRKILTADDNDPTDKSHLVFRLLDANDPALKASERAQQVNCSRHLTLLTGGVLEVQQPFDRETIKELTCSYVVSDGLHQSEVAKIKVEVQDRNDNPPVFRSDDDLFISCVASRHVMQDAQADLHIGNVTAVDRDSTSRINYELYEAYFVNESGPGDSREDSRWLFRIDSTSGRLTVPNNERSRNTPQLVCDTRYSFRITVRTSDNSSPPQGTNTYGYNKKTVFKVLYKPTSVDQFQNLVGGGLTGRSRPQSRSKSTATDGGGGENFLGGNLELWVLMCIAFAMFIVLLVLVALVVKKFLLPHGTARRRSRKDLSASPSNAASPSGPRSPSSINDLSHRASEAASISSNAMCNDATDGEEQVQLEPTSPGTLIHPESEFFPTATFLAAIQEHHKHGTALPPHVGGGGHKQYASARVEYHALGNGGGGGGEDLRASGGATLDEPASTAGTLSSPWVRLAQGQHAAQGEQIDLNKSIDVNRQTAERRTRKNQPLTETYRGGGADAENRSLRSDQPLDATELRVDEDIGEEDDDDVFLEEPVAGAGAGAAGNPPGEQPHGAAAAAAGPPKYYSLQSTSLATNSRNESTVRRETVNRRQADPPLGASATAPRNAAPDGTSRNRLSRLADGSVRYERGGPGRRRREEGNGAGTGGGAIMRSTSQRGPREDRRERVYATVQPQAVAPEVMGGQLCACGITPGPHIHPNIFTPALNYTLPHNYSIYTPYGTQFPQQYYTLSHPHAHQQFIAQQAAPPNPSATASVAYSDHHPNSELYRIFKQSQQQQTLDALPAPSETPEQQTGASPGSHEFVPISATMSPSYATYGTAQVPIAPNGALPVQVAGPLAFQMQPMVATAAAAGLRMAPEAAAALQAQAASLRNSYATYRPAPRALVQNYPQMTAPAVDGPTQVSLREQQENSNRPPLPRPAESLHEAHANIPLPLTDSAAPGIRASTSVSAAAPTQLTATTDSMQNAAGQATSNRPLVLKDPKCTISFV